MSEVADAWLLAVILDGEDNFWLCEPTNLKAVPSGWKSATCRWLYPVEDNVERFADLNGFESTDAVYEVEQGGMSKVLRAATLMWNIKGKRQKMGRTTYVFVPAEEMKIMDEAYSKFVKMEAMQPSPPPQVASEASPTPTAPPAPRAKQREGQYDWEKEEEGEKDSAHVHSVERHFAAAPSPRTVKIEEEGDEGVGGSNQGEEASVVSSSVNTRQDSSQRRPQHHRPHASLNSHKRQTPHRGTTTYQAPVHAKSMGSHRSDEAFDWTEMFIVHRGSVDYLCPSLTNNSYGFRLDRIMHDGFPVFLLFSSARNNSESIDSSARGVPVYEKAKLSGEGGEGSVRGSVLVLTRLASLKHPERSADARRAGGAPRRQQRRRRRNSSSEDDDTTTEDEEEELDSDDADDDDDDDSDDNDSYLSDYADPREGNGGDVEPLVDGEKPIASAYLPRRRTAPVRAAPPPPKKPKAEPSAALATRLEGGEPMPRRRVRRPTAPQEEPPLQAVNVNFWSDPQGVVPDVTELAREFPFISDGADTPQTVVFSDGVCVTYTAATAAKYVAAEKRRQGPKHANTAAAAEDADLSILNEHILNAFAQVQREGA